MHISRQFRIYSRCARLPLLGGSCRLWYSLFSPSGRRDARLGLNSVSRARCYRRCHCVDAGHSGGGG
jgi:hypothetical protein